MEGNSEADRSQLVLVRFWVDPLGGMGGREGPQVNREEPGRTPVHGKVQHVLSGEAANFSDWHDLMEVLDEMLSRWPSAADAERQPD